MLLGATQDAETTIHERLNGLDFGRQFVALQNNLQLLGNKRTSILAAEKEIMEVGGRGEEIEEGGVEDSEEGGEEGMREERREEGMREERKGGLGGGRRGGDEGGVEGRTWRSGGDER